MSQHTQNYFSVALMLSMKASSYIDQNISSEASPGSLWKQHGGLRKLPACHLKKTMRPRSAASTNGMRAFCR